MQGMYKQKKGWTHRMTVPYGTAFPSTPIIGEIFFKYTTTMDDGSLWIYISRAAGTTTGWFKLDNAYYAAT